MFPKRLHTRAITAIATAICAGLLLLCACATQPHTKATPTDTPSPTESPTPNQPVSPVLAATPLPTPTSAAAITSVADLAIQVQAPDSVAAGETTAYTLTVHNHGPALATHIVITDVLPTGVIPVWTESARPLCARQESVVGCDLGDLRGSDVVTITLDLSMGGAESLITGTHLAGVILDLSAPTCAIDQDPGQPRLTCHVPRLERDTAVHLRVGARIDASLAGPLVHTAAVTSYEVDTTPSNNRTAVTLTVGPPTALTVTRVPTATDLVLQAAGPQNVIAGQPFTYTFSITNRGPLEANLVTFQNILPPATDLVGYAPDLPPCERVDDTSTCYLRNPESGATVTVTLVITGNAEQAMLVRLDQLMPGWPICAVLKERTFLHILNCDLGTLRQGQSIQIELALIARGVQEREMVNQAVVNATAPELNPVDNTRHTTITVQVQADLALQPITFPPVIAGSTLSYTLTFANNGPSDADNVVFADTLPPDITAISATASQGESCQVNTATNRVVCDVGRLDSGTTATISVGIAYNPLAEMIIHSASILADQFDPNPNNNELTEPIPIDSTTGN